MSDLDHAARPRPQARRHRIGRPARAALAVLALALVATLGLAGCAGFPPGSGLDGTEWRVTSIDGKAPVAGSEPTIRFEDDQLSGTTGCNSFGGAYTLAGDRLRIEPMMMTEMACEEPLGSQESAMITILQGSDRLVVVGDRMTISGPDGSLELVRVP